MHRLNYGPSYKVIIMFRGSFLFQELEKWFELFKVYQYVALLEEMPHSNKLSVFSSSLPSHHLSTT
jgi:hypothetical protein